MKAKPGGNKSDSFGWIVLAMCKACKTIRSSLGWLMKENQLWQSLWILRLTTAFHQVKVKHVKGGTQVGWACKHMEHAKLTFPSSGSIWLFYQYWYKQFLFFCFFRSSRRSRTDSKTNAKPNKLSSWHVWYFCHTCWPCLWCHWHRLLGAKWQHSWSLFCLLSNINF